MQATEKKEQVVLVRRDSGIVLIIFDNPGKFNYLGTATIDDLEASVDTVRDDESIKGAVIISGKPDSFIIGADVMEIRKCQSVEELHRLSARGQRVLSKLEALHKPFIAAVNGPCLGGGLELILACHYRLATPQKETLFGMPETRLGIIPGIGGTQRLPKQVGLKQALEMILQCETVTAAQALEIGLVDKLVPAEELIEAAEAKAVELIDAIRSVGGKTLKATSYCKTGLDLEKAKKLISISERAVKIRTKGNYPAQTKVLEVIRHGLEHGVEKGMELECQTFAELAGTATSANLMSLFFATDYAIQSAKQMVRKFPGSAISKFTVLGAGQMGTTMACLASAHGIPTSLKTRQSRVEEVKVICSGLHVKSASGAQSSNEVTVTDSDHALAEADLILENFVEDVTAKRDALIHCGKVSKPDCVIASNTSSLTITELTSDVAHPERCVGLHFFHPVDRMPLVEVVYTPETSKAAIARAASFVLALGKTPLLVKDAPGFLINRMLTIYLLEVAELGQTLTPGSWIEEAAVSFGMPMGPFQLMDEVGLLVTFKVAEHLHQRVGGTLTPPSVVYTGLKLSRQGRRANDGYFVWEGDRKLRFNQDTFNDLSFVLTDDKCPPEELARITDQLFLPMIDEAARCLEQKIVNRPREIDMGMVLGVGFPAFRGGLLRYADTLGLKEVCQKLEKIYAASPRPRKVSDLLNRYAEQGRGFYSLAGKED